MLLMHSSEHSITLPEKSVRKNDNAVLIAFLFFIAALALVIVLTGCPPIRTMPWDVSIMLDGGWRLHNGQVPHTDFYNPLGPIYILLVAFGMWIRPLSASAIAYGNALFLVIAIPWAYCIARRRLPTVMALLFSTCLAFLLVAPRSLSGGFQNTGYAMIYNRQGFVLISMLFLYWFIEPSADKCSRAYKMTGFTGGILLALLLYAKINYFGVAAGMFVVSMALYRRPRRWYFFSLLGAAIIVAGMRLFFKINLFHLLYDAVFAGNVQPPLGRLHQLGLVVGANLAPIYIIYISLLVPMLARLNGEGRKLLRVQMHRVILLPTLIIISGLVICTTNAQLREIPLLFVAGLIVLEWLRRERQNAGDATKRILSLGYKLGLLLIIPWCCGTTLLRDMGSVAYSAAWSKLEKPKAGREDQIASPAFRDFFVLKWSNSGVQSEGIRIGEYSAKINDGLQMLKRHVNKQSHVMALDFGNPFNYALGLIPPKGDALWWAVDNSFNTKKHPDPERIFREADFIMVPEVPGNIVVSVSRSMMAIYGEYLRKHYQPIEKSHYWTLWIRKGISPLNTPDIRIP
jgi:hypothetical protein